MKKIGEVFSDYKTNSNIADAEITKMNLLKKLNILEIGMESKEYIEIKEIWYLEKFLREKLKKEINVIFPEFPQIYGAALKCMSLFGPENYNGEAFDTNFREKYSERII